MRTTEFINGEFYHLYNRGVDKRQIFSSWLDAQRFYESLYLFNDDKYDRAGGDWLTRAVSLSISERNQDDRQVYVSILAFILPYNHFHLVVRQEIDNGITKFMHRIGTGYTNYFNGTYERSGSLFEGPFEAVHVADEAQLLHLIRYVHLNALDHTNLPWRDGLIDDWSDAEKELDSFEWSSHGVYCGNGQRLPVVSEKLAGELFHSVDEYRHLIRGWTQRSLEHLPDISELSSEETQ